MNVAIKLFNESKEIFEGIKFNDQMSKEQAIEICNKLQSINTNISRILTRTAINFDLIKK